MELLVEQAAQLAVAIAQVEESNLIHMDMDGTLMPFLAVVQSMVSFRRVGLT
jgi:hypothetical protein